MSVYVTLSTPKSPTLGDIMEFASAAKTLGLDPKSLLVIPTRDSGPNQLSVVVPLDHLPTTSD